MSSQGVAGSFNSKGKGGLAVWLASLISGEARERLALRTEQRSRSKIITTATTTGIAFHPGIIQGITILGGVVGNITVYDSVGVAAGRVLLPALTPIAGGVLLAGVEFLTGLTIVTASAMFVQVNYDELAGRDVLR